MYKSQHLKNNLVTCGNVFQKISNKFINLDVYIDWLIDCMDLSIDYWESIKDMDGLLLLPLHNQTIHGNKQHT